jgi:hypothetical protein
MKANKRIRDLRRRSVYRQYIGSGDGSGIGVTADASGPSLSRRKAGEPGLSSRIEFERRRNSVR